MGGSMTAAAKPTKVIMRLFRRWIQQYSDVFDEIGFYNYSVLFPSDEVELLRSRSSSFGIIMVGPSDIPEQVVSLNVGGQRFATSSHTLTWIPDSFFTSLLSGRIPTVRDDSGAIFIDRDPDVFRIILNYLRTKQVDLSNIAPSTLKHEAQYFGLAPLFVD
ncbi:hypothetical protein V3C99_004322 [Haemonchus contortus]